MGNKNHIKNINNQNFAHFIRGYDKGLYGNGIQSISLLYMSRSQNHIFIDRYDSRNKQNQASQKETSFKDNDTNDSNKRRRELKEKGMSSFI